MHLYIIFLQCLFLLLSINSHASIEPDPTIFSKKIIIAGVGRNVASAVPNTIENAEKLGSHFADYAVIIYENNSNDGTSKLFQQWAKVNPHVTFISERRNKNELERERVKRIAFARNKVLDVARDPKFHDFEYFLMVDLDFTTPWPIEEILVTLESSQEWDCVSANGVYNNTWYFDRYAFRDSLYPFGPELIGNKWWIDLNYTPFELKGQDWIPVYSAFGGLALYKTAAITQFSYSGTITEDLKDYYEKIFISLPPTNLELKKYKKSFKNKTTFLPLIFKKTICCEHLPFHASMALHGYGKFYINPKMIMSYR